MFKAIINKFTKLFKPYTKSAIRAKEAEQERATRYRRLRILALKYRAYSRSK